MKYFKRKKTCFLHLYSQDLAFVLSESSDVQSSGATQSMAADTADKGLSTQCDENESPAEVNGEESAVPAAWQPNDDDDDDDEVRNLTFSRFSR